MPCVESPFYLVLYGFYTEGDVNGRKFVIPKESTSVHSYSITEARSYADLLLCFSLQFLEENVGAVMCHSRY